MPGGRPRTKINWKEFERLCAFQCTEQEIGQWFKCSVDTLDRACKREHGRSFAEYSAEKRGVGRASLRRRQWQLAMEGNPTMLIWLGKQHLDQHDRHEVTGKGGEALIPVQLAQQILGESHAGNGTRSTGNGISPAAPL